MLTTTTMRNFTLLASSLVLLGLGSCKSKVEAGSGTEPKTYGFVTNGIAAFWTIGIAGVRAAEKEFGVTVKVAQPTSKGGASDQKNSTISHWLPVVPPSNSPSKRGRTS